MENVLIIVMACFTACASGLVLFLWVAGSFAALHKRFTCCGGDVLIGCSQMLSGGSTNFMALCYSVIRLVIINHCVMKHPNTNRATWFMLSSSVIKALKVSDTTQPNTGAPAPQDRTQPSGYIYRGYSSEDSCACVLAGG